MAKMRELSCLMKRELLNQAAVSVDSIVAWGQQCEQNGLVYDAVDFYEKAQATEPLLRLLKVSQEEGDAFLFKRINKILKREPSQEEWRCLAGKAEEMGKHSFARQALGHLQMDSPQDRASSEA